MKQVPEMPKTGQFVAVWENAIEIKSDMYKWDGNVLQVFEDNNYIYLCDRDNCYSMTHDYYFIK